MVADRCGDLIFARGDRQIGEVDDRDRGGSGGELFRGEGLEGSGQIAAQSAGFFGAGGFPAS